MYHCDREKCQHASSKRYLLSASIIVGVATLISGCAPHVAGNATGATTIEELVKIYESAHKEKSEAKLRDILWWEAPEARSRPRPDLVQVMVQLFDIELDAVEFVEGPAPDPTYGGVVSYVRRRPGQRRQVDSVIGPVFGKLVLSGSIKSDGVVSPISIDPCYVVMKAQDRYFLDISLPVVEDAVVSVRTGMPSRSEPLPLGTDPATVPKDW